MEELNLNNPKLKILRNLVNISDQDLKTIFINLNKNKNVQLLDYIYYLGLSENFIKEILKNLSRQIPKEREESFEKYTKIILSLRTVEHNL